MVKIKNCPIFFLPINKYHIITYLYVILCQFKYFQPLFSSFLPIFAYFRGFTVSVRPHTGSRNYQTKPLGPPDLVYYHTGTLGGATPTVGTENRRFLAFFWTWLDSQNSEKTRFSAFQPHLGAFGRVCNMKPPPKFNFWHAGVLSWAVRCPGKVQGGV